MDGGDEERGRGGKRGGEKSAGKWRGEERKNIGQHIWHNVWQHIWQQIEKDIGGGEGWRGATLGRSVSLYIFFYILPLPHTHDSIFFSKPPHFSRDPFYGTVIIIDPFDFF